MKSSPDGSESKLFPTDCPVRGRVLLVADDSETAMLISRVLQTRQIVVVSVADLEPAVEAFREIDFDVVLIDLMLRRMHGLQILQALHQSQNDCPSNSSPRSRERDRPCRFVAMTSHDRNLTEDELLEELEEFDSVLFKPFDVTRLVQLFEIPSAGNPNETQLASPLALSN